MTEIGIHFGALAPSLAEQLKDYEINEDDLKHFQLDADAITRLVCRSLIPDSIAVKARQRLLKKIVNKLIIRIKETTDE